MNKEKAQEGRWWWAEGVPELEPRQRRHLAANTVADLADVKSAGCVKITTTKKKVHRGSILQRERERAGKKGLRLFRCNNANKRNRDDKRGNSHRRRFGDNSNYSK